jgi:hypothetical protein
LTSRPSNFASRLNKQNLVENLLAKRDKKLSTPS